MESRNYFDILGVLPFPTIPKNLAALVTEWETRTRNRMNATTDAAEKKEIRDLLDTLTPKLKAFATDAAEQAAQQKDYREIHCLQLRTMAAYMKKTSGTSIRDASIRRLAQQSGLRKEDVEKVFKDEGFEIVKATKAEEVVTDSKVMEGINANLRLLGENLKKGMGHIPPDIARVKTLYDYLDVVLPYEGKDKVPYTDWKTIQAKFKELSVLHAKGTEPFNFYRNIESKASITIFSSEDSKRKYDRYVKMQECGLADSLEAIGGLPESMRVDPVFARSWVSAIQSQLGVTEEEAYLVYNKFCSIPNEQWLEKEDVQMRTICVCGHHNLHESLQVAVKAVCAACGKKLYVPCPSCGEPVRNSSDTCGNCNYYLPGKLIFDRALEQCREEIKRKRIAEARKALDMARANKPKNASLSDVEQQLDALEKSVGSAVVRIDQLILDGKLNDALREIQTLRAANPGIDLGDQIRRYEQKKKEIESMRAKLDQMMRTLPGKPLREQVQICMNVLQLNENYEPAKQQLRSPAMAPRPVSNVKATQNDTEGTVSIAWTPHPENTYVTYTVVRLNSAGIPSSPQQGTLIAKDLKTASCRDKGAEPGKALYYAVFAVRDLVGQWSQAAMTALPVSLRPGTTGFSYTVVNADCILKWEAPKGCAGVMIERTTDLRSNRWDVIQRGLAGQTYTDRNLTMNTQYTYRCTALWNIAGSIAPSPISETITVSLQKKPDPVTLSVTSEQTSGLCAVTWSTANSGQMEIWKLPVSITLNAGTLLEYETLKKMGSSVWKGAAPARTATFNLGGNCEAMIVAACPYGSQSVMGTPVLASTMDSLHVQWEKAALNNDTLAVPAELPAGLSTICVFLNTRDPGRDAILRGRPHVTIRAERAGVQLLSIPNIPQQELDIAIAGVMANGTVLRATAAKINNLPRLPVSYALEWKKKGLFGGKTGGLNVKVSVRGRNTPHVLLCYNMINPTIPFRESEFNPERMAVLLDIPEGRGPVTEASARDADVQALPQGARVKLFLAPDVLSGFKAPTPENALMTTKP